MYIFWIVNNNNVPHIFISNCAQGGGFHIFSWLIYSNFEGFYWPALNQSTSCDIIRYRADLNGKIQDSKPADQVMKRLHRFWGLWAFISFCFIGTMKVMLKVICLLAPFSGATVSPHQQILDPSLFILHVYVNALVLICRFVWGKFTWSLEHPELRSIQENQEVKAKQDL